MVFKQFKSLLDGSPVDPDVDYAVVRKGALKKLFKAFKAGYLTQIQMAKIYDENFDEFVGIPSLSYLRSFGTVPMIEQIQTQIDSGE